MRGVLHQPRISTNVPTGSTSCPVRCAYECIVNVGVYYLENRSAWGDIRVSRAQYINA